MISIREELIEAKRLMKNGEFLAAYRCVCRALNLLIEQEKE